MRSFFHAFRSLVLVLVGLTLPFSETSVDIAGFPLTPNKALAALLLAVVALQWALERRPSHRDPKRYWIPFLAATLGISAIQGILSGSEPGPGYYLAILTTWYTIFLFYFLLVNTLTSRRDLDRLLFSFVVGLLVAAMTGWLGHGAVVESVRYGTRLAGEGGNPNLLAFNLLIGISAAASLYFTASARWRKLFYLGSIGLMTAAVLSSLSRSAYLSLPVMGLLLAVRFRRLDFLRYALPGIALVVFAALFAPERVVQRLLSLNPERIEEDVSARDRFAMLPGIFRAFASNPITGVGLGRYARWAVERGEVAHGIHNAYLTILAESGIVAFVPFAAVLLLSWTEFNRARRSARRLGRREEPELRTLELRATLLQIGYAGVLFMSLGQPTMAHKGLWLLFSLSTVVRGLVEVRGKEIAPAAEPAPLPFAPGLVARKEPAGRPLGWRAP